MHPARIAELLEPFLDRSNGQRLTAAAVQHISTYIDILQRWNARINLTAIRNEEEIVTRHFGESFFAARHLFPLCSPGVNPAAGADKDEAESSASLTMRDDPAGECNPRRNDRARRPNRGRAALARLRVDAAVSRALAPVVADVGSGAGFPGIPLKLWAPQIHLTLIESNHKKATFLREVARALILTNINIQAVRAETLAPTSEEKFDAVTLRAVERFESILPVAACLVAPSGRLALLISSTQVSSARSILPAAAWSSPLPIPQSRSRILLIGTPQV